MSEENTSDVSQEEVKIAEKMEAEEEKSVDTVKEGSPKKEESVKSDSSEVVAENKNSSQENEDVVNEQDEEPQLGLLERPVVIESGKREKKKVERLEMSVTSANDKKKILIPEGTGEKLGDCPIIEYQLNRVKAENLKIIHRALFDRPGSLVEIKRNIRKFNGFDFGKDDKRFDKKRALLAKNTTASLRKICEILGLERGGAKDEILNKIMDFLVKPKDTGKSVPKPKKKRKSGETKSKSKPKKNKKKSSSSQKKKVVSSDSSESDSDEEEEEEEEEQEDEESEQSEESEEEVKEVKKKKKSKPEKKPSKEKKKEKKKETPKKKVVAKKRKVSDVSSDSSDDEPIIKKKKSPPSDEELHEDVKKILEGANLEEVTMKTVIKQVYAKYPDFDLTQRKEFIKSTVKQIIS
ncbi:protein DEK-like [Octopus vulgaris]|uniref:Protein DEK n=1 Tax=Octopus vulgaris TaxID=6645 RepID=A0AA36BT61_OCTVU|nr:protein DEK-like [Octopus vulgaris]